MVFLFTFFIFDRADMRNFFSLLPTIFSFIIPAVTMALFSEEINVGSYETLMTLPVSFRDIALWQISCRHGLFRLHAAAHPGLSPLYIHDWRGGLWPCHRRISRCPAPGRSLLFPGNFCLQHDPNQIVAFILGAAICFTLTILDRILFFTPASLTEIIGFLGTNTHFQSISKGVIDSRDILYFLSVMFLGLFGTYLVMQKKN